MVRGPLADRAIVPLREMGAIEVTAGAWLLVSTSDPQLIYEDILDRVNDARLWMLVAELSHNCFGTPILMEDETLTTRFNHARVFSQ